MYYKEANFQNLLKKLAITLSDAYRILEVPENTKDENLIKKNFKKLTLKYHPDLGGSHEKMVELNQAKDRIDLAIKNKDFSRNDSYGGYSSYTQRRQPDPAEARKQWEQKKQQQDEKEKKQQQELEKKLHEFKNAITSKKDDYFKHFKAIIGEEPRFFIKEKINVGYYNSNFDVDLKFKFEDGSECSININYNSSENAKQYPYYYKSDVYYDNKLFKMQKSRLNSTDSYNWFLTPENLFPKNKLLKIFNTKTTETKPKLFKRKDAEAMLIKEVFAKNVDSDTWKIQIDDIHFVYVFRQVFMKHGTWIVKGLYEKYKRIAMLPSTYHRTYFETLDKSENNNFLEFIDLLKEAKKKNIDWGIPY